MVWPFLPKILCLCLSNLPNFLQKGLRNYSSPMLAGVKLPLFCQFRQQQHVPQIRQCASCLGTIIGSPVRLLHPNLGNAMIEVGTKQFFIKICPRQVICHMLLLTWSGNPKFSHKTWDLMPRTSSPSSRSTRKLANLRSLVCEPPRAFASGLRCTIWYTATWVVHWHARLFVTGLWCSLCVCK